jgi:hypothetical protein
LGQGILESQIGCLFAHGRQDLPHLRRVVAGFEGDGSLKAADDAGEYFRLAVSDPDLCVEVGQLEKGDFVRRLCLDLAHQPLDAVANVVGSRLIRGKNVRKDHAQNLSSG